MAVNTRVWVVQGLQIDTFTVKKDKVKIVLMADKDDISAQNGNIGDILSSLEAHSSGEYPVEVTLGRCDVNTDEE